MRGYLHILCIGVTKYPSRGTSVFLRPERSMQFWGGNRDITNYIFKTCDYKTFFYHKIFCWKVVKACLFIASFPKITFSHK